MASTPGFQLLFENLEAVGFFEFFLPILLFTAIYYGLLRKTEILGEDETVDGAAAVMMALLTTFAIYLIVPFSIFIQFFGVLSILLLVILGLLIVMGMFGVEFGGGEGMDSRTTRLAIIGVIFLIVIIIPPMVSMLGGGQLQILGQQHVSFILTVAMIAVIGYVLRHIGG